MSLLLHAMEACGLLLAASSVRMVAGPVPGVVAAAIMITIRWGGGKPAPLLLPSAVCLMLLLRVAAHPVWRERLAFPVMAGATAIFLWSGAKSNWDLDRIALTIAPIPACWLAMALRDRDGAAATMAAVPLALISAGEGTARLLLAGTTVALAGLITGSYRLKRYHEGG